MPNKGDVQFVIVTDASFRINQGFLKHKAQNFIYYIETKLSRSMTFIVKDSK